jgi:membrane fusion protein, multidrug efflux system
MRALRISASAQRATLRLTYISRMKTDGHLTPEPVATAPAATPVAAPKPSVVKAHLSRRRLIIGALAIATLAFAIYHGYPIVQRMLNTVSTDDAYVSGHVTFVAARVSGQVVKVLVDDNNRVAKNDLLVQLDKQPFQVQVDIKKAMLADAQANVGNAENEVRAIVARARANRYKLEHSIEDVNNQIASLRASVAALETAKARQERAKADYQRALEVQKTPGAISPQEVDLRAEGFRVAEAQVKQAREQVYQIRVTLGLPAQTESDAELSKVPPDLDQNFSTVRQALADLLESAAPLGIVPPSYNATPKEVVAAFYKRDPEGNLDRIYAELIKNVPTIKLAQAKLEEAQGDLAQAELNLSYCDIVAEIDGVITRRNVNPGNNVQAGQSLMALRSLTDIWIDANFKETQLSELRIGQRVEMEVDMYGKRHLFPGRISGFTMGTGSTLALLPAENATGNFIKVVQRLPVRIDPVDYDPDKDPLFIGLSVVPYVYVKEPPTGPDAGKFLQPNLPLPKIPQTDQVLPSAASNAKPAEAATKIGEQSSPTDSSTGRPDGKTSPP